MEKFKCGCIDGSSNKLGKGEFYSSAGTEAVLARALVLAEPPLPKCLIMKHYYYLFLMTEHSGHFQVICCPYIFRSVRH